MEIPSFTASWKLAYLSWSWDKFKYLFQPFRLRDCAQNTARVATLYSNWYCLEEICAWLSFPCCFHDFFANFFYQFVSISLYFCILSGTWCNVTKYEPVKLPYQVNCHILVRPWDIMNSWFQLLITFRMFAIFFFFLINSESI